MKRKLAYLRSVLRRAWLRSPYRSEVLKNKRFYRKTKIRNSYRNVYFVNCDSCGERFRLYDVQVDHIVPCGSLKDWSDLPRFCERLFDEDNMQVLCKECHAKKTASERANRS